MGKVIGTNKFHCGKKVMKNIFQKLLSGMSRADLNSIYSSTDAWEAELVRSAMINEGVSATVKSNEYFVDVSGKKRRRYAVFVPESSLDEAQLVLKRALIIISNKEKIILEQEKIEYQIAQGKDKDKVEGKKVPEPKPSGEPLVIAEKQGVGQIIYYDINDVYELRLDFDFYKNSHFMNAEEWDEFTNFSAQRQEFFILLKEKYPKLAELIKEHKKRADFIKLIEYSYGKSQPPKTKHQ
jgi:hypothetical protein